MMRRIALSILLLAMLVSLAACGETGDRPGTPGSPDTEDVGAQAPEQTGSDSGKTDTPADEKTEKLGNSGPVPLQVLLGTHCSSEWDEESTLLCSVDWNSLVLGEESAAQFPALEASLREMNTDDCEYNLRFLGEMLPEARELAREREYFSGFTSSSEYFVQRADERILSVRVDVGEYTGGVHPNYGVVGLNLCPATGQTLPLTDVLTDTRVLPAILTEKIREKYTFEPFLDLQEQLEEYGADDYTWTLDYQGITFYFSPYEIAPYAAGLLTATVWFDELPELFVQEYTAGPEGGWAKMFPEYHEIEMDLDGGDGEWDTLSARSFENEYGSLQLYLTKNGQEQELEGCRGFDMKTALVCLGKPGLERFFLYVEATAENDDTTIYVYDLNRDETALSGALPGARFTGVWDEEAGEYGAWYEYIFNDPSEFVLSTTIRLLGTQTGSRTYATDPQSGLILPMQEYYKVYPMSRTE